MGFGRYKNTPLSVNGLADSCLSLLHNQTITADVLAAVEHVPFRFHPAQDSEFFDDIYWQVPVHKRIAAGKKLAKRFDRWYQGASPLERIYCAVGALTESDDTIDTVIDDAKMHMAAKYRMQFQDCDDAIYWITDYHAARDPFNIANAFNTEQFNWWKDQFEKQAARVLCIPRWPFDQFLLWNEARRDNETLIRSHFKQNVFTQHGYTVRQGRRVITRSMKLMDRFLGSTATREFLQGKPLKIRAHYFEWVLRMNRRRFIENTLIPPNDHVPYSMSLNDLEGRHLADACVVFQDTPILDQAVAVALHVSNPEDELDLLSRTNIFCLTRAGLANENLKRLKLPGLTRRDEIPWDQEEPDTELEQQRVTRAERQRERLEQMAEDFANQPQSPFVESMYGIQERRDAQREVDRFDPDEWGGFDPAFHEEEVDLPARLTLTIFENEDPFELEVNTMVDDLGAIVRLPNRQLQERGFRGHVVDMFREVLLDQARIRLARERDPIACRLREEMYRRLDVQPDLLEYMAKPEFTFHYLDRLKRAPRLESFIRHGVWG